MRKIVSGRIYEINEEEKIITLKFENRLMYFYLQRSLHLRIEKYITINRFIQFVINDEPRMYHGIKVYNIEYILKIMEIRYRKNIVYYDMKNIKNGTKTLLNSLTNKMFLDLEMSMHPYSADKHFTQEIIQVGIYLVDANNNLIEKYCELIKPKLHPELTRRTLKFLKITQEEIEKGIEYIDFYKHFKYLIETYNPAIIVWGRNDFLALRDSYKINKVPNLHHKTRYINLLKLHKNYFNLRNDLGLFNALKIYSGQETLQTHNALEDAIVTFNIYKGFKKIVDYHLDIDLQDFK